MSIEFEDLAKVMKSNGITKSKDGGVVMVIDVFSIMGSGKFVLTTFTSDSKFVDLLHGMPQEVHLARNRGILLKYFNYFKSAFKVKVTRETGWADLQISTCKTDDIDACLES